MFSAGITISQDHIYTRAASTSHLSDKHPQISHFDNIIIQAHILEVGFTLGRKLEITQWNQKKKRHMRKQVS